MTEENKPTSASSRSLMSRGIGSPPPMAGDGFSRSPDSPGTDA
ncbi:MAG: hypothetical protein ACLRNW_22160 [Neglectibacter sp.]